MSKCFHVLSVRLASACKLLLFFPAILMLPSVYSFEFARGARPFCVIACSDKAGPLEKMALDDLQQFLGAMCGSPFQVLPESQVGQQKAIYVGQTQFAARHGIDFANLGQEEWVIQNREGNLIICGGRPAGTFYGVWAVLKKAGCWSLTMDQLLIPHKPDLAVDIADEQKQPAFAGRLIYNDFPGKAMLAKMPPQAEMDYNLWLLRSGINGPQTHRSKPYYIGGMYNISHTPQSHTLSLYVDPDQYFESHPAYFSMNAQGKRFRPEGKTMRGSLCMSNPEVARITLESLRSMVHRDRAARPREEWPFLYDISILDASPFICKCPDCVKISEEEGSECGLLLRYINFVAREIGRQHPELIIRTFAYSATRIQPKITRPEKNVLLQLCDEFPVSDAFRPLTSEFNRHRLEDLKKWQSMGAQMMIWDYWNLGNQYFDPPRVEVLIDAIGPDIRLFHQLGSKAMFIEAERDFVSPQNFIDLEYFLACELMMDPFQDEERLIQLFMEGYYGPAAAPMQQWLQQLRDGVRAHPKLQTILTAGNWSYMTAPFALQSYQLLRNTAQALPEKSLFRRRVEDEMITLIWATLNKRVAWESTFRAAGIDMDERIAECRQYVLNHIHRYGAREPGYLLDMFAKKFQAASVSLPRPEKFRDVADEDIRVIAWPQARENARAHAHIVADPESTTGKALRSAHPDPAWHGIGQRVQVTETIKVPASKFELGNIGVGTPKAINSILTTVPQDEKYHWYPLTGTFDMREKSYFWGHAWGINFDTSTVYVLADGIADNNSWQCWFSAKFTGPAYVAGSSQGNAVYVDQVILVRPGSMPTE